MKKYGILFGMTCLLTVACLSLSGCQKQPETPALPEPPAAVETPVSPEPPAETEVLETPPENAAESGIPGIKVRDFPEMDGSTAALPLMAHLYAKAMDIPLEQAETMVRASKTNEAWEQLMKRDGGTVLLVYEPSEQLLEEYAEEYRELEIEPVGRDALVFLTHQNNAVDGLTTSQLQEIYSGNITNWREIGGKNRPIAAIQRNEGSGSQTMFLKLLMSGRTPMKPASEHIEADMGFLMERLADFGFGDNGGAIGYSVYYYAKEMYAHPELKMIKVDGVAPDADTIRDASYPLTNAFYAVIRGDEPVGSPARTLRDWLLTEEGQALVRAAGYVDSRES